MTTDFDGWGTEPGPDPSYQFTHVARNKTPQKRRGKTPEAKVKAQVDNYLKLIGALNIRTNAGSWQDDQGHIIQGAKAGTSDHTCCLPGGRFVAIEDKAAKGTLSDAQKAYRQRVLGLGGLWIEARSADDVRAALVTAFGEQTVRDWETLGRARQADVRRKKSNI